MAIVRIQLPVVNRVPATNNLTEQMIGNDKVRSRTVRCYKSRGGVLAAFLVCAARLA